MTAYATNSRKLLVWGGLAIVLIVAALFRFWQIGGIPPGLFGDEAADGLDALDVLAGRGQIFFPGNFGREGLHMVIVAASIKALGVTPLAVRLPSALAGLLTCLATFWLGWELFAGDGRETPGHQRRRWLLALTAALYLATSFWHVHFYAFRRPRGLHHRRHSPDHGGAVARPQPSGLALVPCRWLVPGPGHAFLYS